MFKFKKYAAMFMTLLIAVTTPLYSVPVCANTVAPDLPMYADSPYYIITRSPDSNVYQMIGTVQPPMYNKAGFFTFNTLRIFYYYPLRDLSWIGGDAYSGFNISFDVSHIVACNMSVGSILSKVSISEFYKDLYETYGIGDLSNTGGGSGDFNVDLSEVTSYLEKISSQLEAASGQRTEAQAAADGISKALAELNTLTGFLIGVLFVIMFAIVWGKQ